MATANLSVKCTHPTAYNVDLGAGEASEAGTAGVIDTLGRTGNGWVQKLSVLGQIPAGQRLEGRPYGDSVVVTVTY